MMDKRELLLAILAAPSLAACHALARGEMGVTASSVPELLAALKVAKGGETIVMAPGVYPGFNVAKVKPLGPVVITGAGVVFGPSIVYDCENLSFEGVAFRDEIEKARNGLLIRISKFITVRKCEFSFLGGGVGHLSSSDLLIEHNNLHDIGADGIAGGDGCARITIRGNRFTDFYPKVGFHPDAIQIWTAKATAETTDIVIEGNVIVRGVGGKVQGVFLGDESAGKFPYRRVRIVGNTLIGTGTNGIAVSGHDILIADNTVAGFGEGNEVSRIRVDGGTGIQVTNNDAQAVIYPKGRTGSVETGTTTIAAIKDGGASILQARALAAPL